jgi:hypothetical protein
VEKSPSIPLFLRRKIPLFDKEGSGEILERGKKWVRE